MLQQRRSSHSTCSVSTHYAIIASAEMSLAPDLADSLQVEHLAQGKHEMLPKDCDKEARMLRLSVMTGGFLRKASRR